MTKEQLAEQINGSPYGYEINKEQERLAKLDGLIVVFGASDDLLEFRGAIHEELEAYEGCEAVITRKGGDLTVMGRLEFDDELEVARKYGAVPVSFPVTAEFDPEELSCTWLIKTDLPHATFDIMEDGDLFCRGIVIDVKDLKAV